MANGTKHIAKWDGQSWSSVGNGFGNKNGFIYVNAFAAKGEELYVGGVFDVAGEVAAEKISPLEYPHQFMESARKWYHERD